MTPADIHKASDLLKQLSDLKRLESELKAGHATTPQLNYYVNGGWCSSPFRMWVNLDKHDVEQIVINKKNRLIEQLKATGVKVEDSGT